LYKINGKEIYIFIKISNTKDNNLIYKIFNLAMEIINYWNNNMMKKSLRYPIVIPIVVYTGKEDGDAGDEQFEINDNRSFDRMYKDMEDGGLQPVVNEYIYV